MLPKNISDDEVSALFSKYGTVKDLQILQGTQQTGKGCAFLKYETKEQALAALEAINGKYKMEGSSVPLVVKWADTEKERQARRTQKAQTRSSNAANVDSMHRLSLFGAMRMGYIPPYDGFSYQYSMPPMQNQPGFHNMVPPVKQGNALRRITPELDPGMAPRSFATM
ncbi:hypothetical protein NE237_011396 [Protea cynaroides]|uniref:RRM domain-containing protein n=1 Tax=Protea cynaroides TaxID=273540 RepID=A0A9Q0GVK9_9MAGN|nr:hypothetical protein NE237_011396 [Protea cynaroides]